MKTKIIPFDLETAKKIQSGEINGRVMCNNAEANIIDLDMRFNSRWCICAQTFNDFGRYETNIYNEKGYNIDSEINHSLYIELEVPDNEPQFKPFDKVLVRDENFQEWEGTFYSHTSRDPNAKFRYITVGGLYKQIIPYEGNEHLLGTTDNPKED